MRLPKLLGMTDTCTSRMMAASATVRAFLEESAASVYTGRRYTTSTDAPVYIMKQLETEHSTMKAPLDLDLEDFSKLYCETQLLTPLELRMRLEQQIREYNPNGFMLLRCVDMSSPFFGQRTILPYGPNNTYKDVPDHHISPRGLASDMSEVEALWILKD